MNILVVGGTGTIGQAVVKELKQRHTVIVAGHSRGDVQVDINHTDSIEAMYQSIHSELDAVVATTGKVQFAELSKMTAEDYHIGLQSKLMGQVNLVLIGMRYVKQGGSFTLTSGVLSHDPIVAGSSAAMVNGAIDAFVKSAAIELSTRRINAVSPTVVTESMPVYAPYFRGFESVSAARAALAYSKSVEGAQTGQIYRVL